MLILDGYIEGTKHLPFPQRIEIPRGTTILGENIHLMVSPVSANVGKDLTGKVVLIDQFKRKHTTDEIAFTWVAATEPSRPPTQPTEGNAGIANSREAIGQASSQMRTSLDVIENCQLAIDAYFSSAEFPRPVNATRKSMEFSKYYLCNNML